MFEERKGEGGADRSEGKQDGEREGRGEGANGTIGERERGREGIG